MTTDAGYADALSFGVQSDCHIVPDIERLIGALEASFSELGALAAARSTSDAPAHVRPTQRIEPLDGPERRRLPPLAAHPVPSGSQLGGTASAG